MSSRCSVVMVCTLIALACVLAVPAHAGVTTRVSVASDGTEANHYSFRPSISADGRHVAFYSPADNLVPEDTCRWGEAFARDRWTGQTTLVSVVIPGLPGGYFCTSDVSCSESMSADGRYVAFFSEATNLVPGGTNAGLDVFVRDRWTGQTTLVSVASDGTQGNHYSRWPSISADGRYVAFQSAASNLVPGDTNDQEDVFVHDRLTGETTRVSVASDGTQANGGSYEPSISGDGRHVAFYSWANNLVLGDANGYEDIFVHDRLTGQTTRVSVASDGTESNEFSCCPSVDADGRHVAFHSDATNLVPADTNGKCDIFVHDRLTGQTTRVSVASDGTEGNDYSAYPSISEDGRHVAFESKASNLVPGDTNGELDIFAHDRQTGETSRVSVASDGTEANDWSEAASISADGRHVAFECKASNLVPGDTNNRMDIFVHDRGPVCECDVAIDTTHCVMPAAGHVGQCKRGQIGARNESFTESCDVVLRVTDNAGNAVFETVETIGPGRRIRVRFEHCYTAEEVGRNLWAWEVWPIECTESTPRNNVHLRKVNVQPGVRSSTRNRLPLWRLWRR